jgi:allantoinase
VVFDPETTWKVDAFRLQHRHKNTPYHRAKVRGVVLRTYVRGTIVYDHGTFPSEPAGQWIKHR